MIIMTINNLFGEVIERPEFELDNMEPKNNLSELPAGTWIAVDAYIIVFRALVRIECARQFNMDPICPVTWIEEYFRHWLGIFE